MSEGTPPGGDTPETRDQGCIVDLEDPRSALDGIERLLDGLDPHELLLNVRSFFEFIRAWLERPRFDEVGSIPPVDQPAIDESAIPPWLRIRNPWDIDGMEPSRYAQLVLKVAELEKEIGSAVRRTNDLLRMQHEADGKIKRLFGRIDQVVEGLPNEAMLIRNEIHSRIDHLRDALKGSIARAVEQIVRLERMVRAQFVPHEELLDLVASLLAHCPDEEMFKRAVNLLPGIEGRVELRKETDIEPD